MTKYTDFIDTNIYLNAAKELGFDIEVIDYNRSFARVYNKNTELLIYRNWLSLNDQVTYAFAKDKFVSGKILGQIIPELTPETILVDKKDKNALNKMVNFANKHNFSIVIKPNKASLGEGVHILPKDEKKVKSITSKLIAEYETILGQKYLKAKNEYRVVYLKGQFFDTVRRINAHVVGDGQSSISKLVAEKNQQRKKHDFPLIELDQHSLDYLSEQGLTPQSVPEKETKVKLKKVCSFSQGGETERVDKNKIHPEYMKAFEKVAKANRLQFLGIDLMTSKIDQPPTDQDGINEINSAPMADLHYFADLTENKPLDSAKKLLLRVFSS